MSLLFTPLNFKNVTLKNRIVMSPMCQYSAKDGFATDWHLVHYGARAAGGAGMIIVEATAVSPEGRITPGDLGLWSDEHIPALKNISEFIIKQGSVPAIQLAHAGRKASCAVPWEGGKQLALENGGWKTIAPSALPFMPGERTPEPLGLNRIKLITEKFAEAAARAKKAGFRVIEIHSAHGYLLQEFLSPLSNNRNDNYAGPLENRARLLAEVIQAVWSEWPRQNPLIVRISSTEWTHGGWSVEDSVKLASMLKAWGVDVIDCSSGGNVYDAKIPFGPGYQVPFSEAVRKTGITTGAVGMITSSAQAEAILQEGKADLIFMGKELLRNPGFPLKAAKELGEEINWPVQYLRAKL